MAFMFPGRVSSTSAWAKTCLTAGAPSGVALLAEIRRRLPCPWWPSAASPWQGAGGHRGRGRRGVRHRRGGHPAEVQAEIDKFQNYSRQSVNFLKDRTLGAVLSGIS